MMIHTTIIPAVERKLKNHVSFGAAAKNTLTFAYRSLLKAVKNPESFMDITAMPIMFTLMFTFLFGGAIAGDIAEYLPIIIPGILIQTCVTASGTAGTQLREDADKSVTARFKSMPVARISPLAGVLTADLVRYAIAGILVFAIGGILGLRPEAGIGAVLASIAFMMFIGWCLSWMFSFFTLTAKSAASASSFTIIIMFPLLFLSNGYVPTETMPGVIRFFAEHINPLSKVITSIRQLLQYGTIGTEFWLALAGALIILAVFIPLTLRIYTGKA
jgi:ABC-2 type transport system permease protein